MQLMTFRKKIVEEKSIGFEICGKLYKRGIFTSFVSLSMEKLTAFDVLVTMSGGGVA